MTFFRFDDKLFFELNDRNLWEPKR